MLSLNSITLFAQWDKTWKEVKNSDGITVHTRSVNGSRSKEFIVKAIVSSKLSNVMDLILDFKSYPSWSYNYSACDLLKKNSKTEYLYTATIKAPWPVADRDLAVQLNVIQSEEKTVLTLQGVPSVIPTEKGKVRITKFNGEWTLKPLNENSTEVVCQLHAEPAGNIPEWLANMMISEAPYKTLLGMKKKLAITPQVAAN